MNNDSGIECVEDADWRPLKRQQSEYRGENTKRAKSAQMPDDVLPKDNGISTQTMSESAASWSSQSDNKKDIGKTLSSPSARTHSRSAKMALKRPANETSTSEEDVSTSKLPPKANDLEKLNETSGTVSPPPLLDENAADLPRDNEKQPTVSLRPPILQLSVKEMARFVEHFPVDSGCVISIHVTEPLPVAAKTRKTVEKMLQQSLERWGPRQWEGLLREWIEAPRDTSADIQEALTKYQALRQAYPELVRFGGDEELRWWRHRVGRPALRNLAKIRRVMTKITVQVVYQGQTCHVQTVGASLADVFLRLSSVRNEVLDTLLGHLAMIHIWTSRCGGSLDVLTKYASLRQSLYCTLRRFGGTHFFQGKHLDLSSLHASDLVQQRCVDRRSYNEKTKLELLDIREKRREIFEMFSNNNQNELPVRLLEGFILLTERQDGVSEEEFLEESYFMSKVNKTLVRPFDPLVSTPRMARIRLNREKVCKLRHIFFDADGSLSRSCASDALMSSKHHYINFTNSSNAGSGDKRWQIPIRLQSEKPVDTRVKVEALLSSAGAIDLRHEKTDDIGVLVGGTEDQSLHHDMAKEITAWLPDSSGSVDEAIVGWEANRLEYNNAMSGRHPPRAMVIGLGESDSILLGVQKDQIQRNVGARSDRCHVKNGRQYEEFRVVRENSHLAVLEVRTGCVFTGDFPHAGVRNVEPNSSEDSLMKDLYRQIDAILELEPDDEVEQTQLVLDMLCGFKGLNRICRFYCSTKLVKTNLRIPENTIGYSGCSCNRPSNC